MQLDHYVSLSNPWESLVRTTVFIESLAGNSFQKGGVHLLGIPFDATTSYRPGARFGATQIREASMNLEGYSPYLNRSLSEIDLIDLGNIPYLSLRFDWVREVFSLLTKDLDLKNDKIKLITLGGEHSISYCPISLYLKQYPDLVVIHLDAHTDLRDGFIGEKFSHASVIYRIYEEFQKSHQLIQYGIRSGSKDEFVWMEKHKTLCHSREEFLSQVEKLAADRPIYLTLDLDYFDPSFLPGTGTPEAGGEDFHSFIKLMKILMQKNFVGADVVELAPQLDTSGNSSAMAAKIVREIALALT